MSVSYTAILAVGLSDFDGASEVVDLLNEYNLLSEDDKECLESEGDYYIQEILSGGGDMPTVECLNAYDGRDYYIGFPLSVREPEKFADNVKEAFDKWNKLFPNHPASIVHEVRIS
jgi:hypothetical protein